MPLVYLSRYVFQRAELRAAFHPIWEGERAELGAPCHPDCTAQCASRPHTTEGRAFCFCPILTRSARRSHQVPALNPRSSGRISSTSQRGKVNTLPSQSCPDSVPSIYRLVPPTCECHGDNPDLLQASPLGTCRGRRVRCWWHHNFLSSWDLADTAPDTIARWEGTRGRSDRARPQLAWSRPRPIWPKAN